MAEIVVATGVWKSGCMDGSLNVFTVEIGDVGVVKVKICFAVFLDIITLEVSA